MFSDGTLSCWVQSFRWCTTGEGYWGSFSFSTLFVNDLLLLAKNLYCTFALQSRAKWLRHSSKISYNLAFSLVFNEIALNPIDSPLVPLFNVEYIRLSDRFCGCNNIAMGGGVKENRGVRDRKSS